MTFPSPPGFPKPPTTESIVETVTQSPIGPEQTDESRVESKKLTAAEIFNRIPKPTEIKPVVTEGPVKAPVQTKQLEAEEIIKLHLTRNRAQDSRVVMFIDQYLLCRDPAQAGAMVGFNKRESKKLLRYNDVYAAIKAVTIQYPEKYNYNADDVVERAKEIAEVDPIDFQNSDGSFKENLADVAPEVRRAVKKFSAVNMYEDDPNGMRRIVGKFIKVEFWSKEKAIELLGREKDLFVEKKRVEHEIGRNMSQTLLESKKLAEGGSAEYRDVTPVKEEEGE